MFVPSSAELLGFADDLIEKRDALINLRGRHLADAPVIWEKVDVITAEVQEFVRRQRLGFVATVAPDGTPAVSPKGTTTVWDDSHLVFADIASPGTVRNLRANPAVQVNVVDVILRRGYRFTGTAEVHDRGSLFERGVHLYAERGLAAPESRIRTIVLIAVTAVEPLWSPAYDLGQSEDELRDQWWSYWAAIYDPGPTRLP